MVKEILRRHTAQIPIDYKIDGEQRERTDHTKNISFGGLCFQTQSYIKPGTALTLKFPTFNPKMEVGGKIVWCSQKKDYVDVGVQFFEENDIYRVKIVEKICYLKSTQKEIFEKDGVNQVNL